MRQVKVKRTELAKQVEAGKITKEAAAEEAKKLEDEHHTEADKTLWRRGVSNQDYHYNGYPKIFALMEQAFANAILEMPRP